MKYLCDIMKNFLEECEEKSFSETIKEARDTIGLMKYRAAEHAGLLHARLRNLETGYFRELPRDEELRGLCRLYGFDFDYLLKKAQKEVNSHKKAKKVRMIIDGTSALPHMCRRERQQA